MEKPGFLKRTSDALFNNMTNVLRMVQPLISVIICAYLLYVYADILQTGRFTSLVHEGTTFLNAEGVRRLITYAVVFLGFATLFEVGALIVQLLQRTPMSEGSMSKVLKFGKGFARLTTPVLAATMLQLFAVHTLVSKKQMLADDHNGAVGILIWFESARALYDASNVNDLNLGGKWHEFMEGTRATFASVFLAGCALVYKLMQGDSMVHTWWFLLGTLVVYVGLGLNLFSDMPSLAKFAKSVMGVVLVYLSSLIFVETPTHSNLVTVMLLVAAAVLGMSHEEDDSRRLNEVWYRLKNQTERQMQNVLRLLHIGVGVVGALALMDKDGEDAILFALGWAGVFVKIVSSLLRPSQCEFLARNASTLMLLIPFSAMQVKDSDVLQTVAFILAVAARGVDALQNTKLSQSDKLLGSLDTNLKHLGNELTNNVRSPIPYAILLALVTSATLMGEGFNDMWEATKWAGEERFHTYLVIAFALVLLHGVLALISVSVGTAKFIDPARVDDKWGYAVLSTLELVRATVASVVIALLTIVVFQTTIGVDKHALVAALMTYVFADIYGRNVV